MTLYYNPRRAGMSVRDDRFSIIDGVLTVADGSNKVHGDIHLSYDESIVSLGNLREVRGSLYLSSCENLRSLGSLTCVHGIVDLFGCGKLTNIDALRYVNGTLDLSGTQVTELPSDIKVTRSFIGFDGMPVRPSTPILGQERKLARA